MAAEVETMFYTSNTGNGRFVPWHGLGVAVEEAPNSHDALITAGLDWTVEKIPAQYTFNGQLKTVPETYHTVRNTDGHVLGTITDRYQIVQNEEAFAFTDELIGGDVRYETAGSLKNGRVVWLLTKMPQQNILGDDIDNFICFANSHDGKGSVRAFCTPVRICCSNTLNLALSQAKRSWSMRHTGDVAGKIAEARRALDLAYNYNEQLGIEAERLANITIPEAKMTQWIYDMFPIKDDDSKRKVTLMQEGRNNLLRCYNAPDISRFKGTGWGVINAVADYVDHTAPARDTTTFKENRWGSIMTGNKMLDDFYTMVKQAA